MYVPREIESNIYIYSLCTTTETRGRSRVMWCAEDDIAHLSYIASFLYAFIISISIYSNKYKESCTLDRKFKKEKEKKLHKMNDKTGNDVGLNDVTSMSPQLKWMTQKPCGLYTQSHQRHKVGCGTWIWRVYIYIYQRKSTMRRVCIPWTPFLSFFNSQHLLLFIRQCLQLLALFHSFIHSFIHACFLCAYIIR